MQNESLQIRTNVLYIIFSMPQLLFIFKYHPILYNLINSTKYDILKLFTFCFSKIKKLLVHVLSNTFYEYLSN